jgi:hypothetical protein
MENVWLCAVIRAVAYHLFHLTLQHFAADNIKAGAAAPAADKKLATFGNGIFCVVVALLRVLPNGRLHRVVLVHVVNVYLCKTRVSDPQLIKGQPHKILDISLRSFGQSFLLSISLRQRGCPHLHGSNSSPRSKS